MQASIYIPGKLPADGGNFKPSGWKRQMARKASRGAVQPFEVPLGWNPALRYKLALIHHRPATAVRIDLDNVIARCKGYIDGLVEHGWLTDDSYRHVAILEARVEPGAMGLTMVLETMD